MRWLAIVFIALIVGLQYPMWLGKGGWLQVRETDRQLALQREANEKLRVRNAALDADVRDLKTGSEAIEERARSELGMIRSDEVFFQLQQGAVMSSAATRDAAGKEGAARTSPSKTAAPKGAMTAATGRSAPGASSKGAAETMAKGAADTAAKGAADTAKGAPDAKGAPPQAARTPTVTPPADRAADGSATGAARP